MIFDGKFSVSLFNLVFSGILVKLQNFEWVEFFLYLLREVFFEEIFFRLGDSILVEETIKDFLRISGLVSLGKHLTFNGSDLSEMNSWRSQESRWEEERIIKIKEMPDESSAHCSEIIF